MSTLIETIEARKAKIDKKLDALVALAETEKRNVTDEESTKVDALIEKRAAVVKSLEAAAKVEEVRAEAGATLKAANVLGYGEGFGSGERDAPYREGGTASYYRDLRAARQLGDSDARDRLIKNDRHRIANEERAESTTAGAGGDFDPPLYQINQWVKLMRPARTTADVVNKIVIPKGVSSINLPKIVTGTATAQQTSQNTGINVQDITTSTVTTAITTVAGGAVYSLQWLAQSPIPVDGVITDDIGRDLATKIDAAVIAGIAATAGLNAVTYTNVTPTTALLGQFVQVGIDQITGTNYTKPNAIIMRPDRWGRMLAYGDSAGRPLVLPNPNYGPFNVLGAANGQTVQGYAGEYRGVPVFLDPLIPNNLGAGLNQDEVFILDATQINLYESAPTVETFDATYANQMSMFLRIYEYYGLIANRLPKAISLIAGTGMIPGAYGS
jgi:HK97 family phage major capsid protein